MPGQGGVRTGYATATGTTAPTDTTRAAGATDTHNPAAGTAVTTGPAVAAGSTVGSRIPGCGAGTPGLPSQAVSACTTCSTCTPQRQQPRTTAAATITAVAAGTCRLAAGAAIAAVTQE